MAEKKPRQSKKVERPSEQKAPNKPAGSGGASNPNSQKNWLWASAVVVLTLLVFMGVTKLEWTNWDDDEYVYENAMVMEGNYGEIFSTPVNNNYNPLPVVMHAWEWQMTDGAKDLKARAWLFHFNNLWMHLLCTMLVFWLMLKLGLQPQWAFLAALLFGIHPMRVESVAWVTERKDVMFGTFYVGALLAYLQSQERPRWIWYVLSLVLFVLSLLSKIQAVSLPLSMLAIDWYKGRKFFPFGKDWKPLLEKVPFLAGAVIVGLVGVMFLQEGKTLGGGANFSLLERVALGLSTYVTYVIKAFVPYEMCTYYPYPTEVGALYYLGLVGAVGILAGAILLHKRSPETTFGVLFFTVNVMFLLQIVAAGSAYKADRFTYIAYIGLFFLMGMLAQRAAGNKPALKWVLMGGLGLLAVTCMGLTYKYIPVWKDSDTLWSHVIKLYENAGALPYNNRGQYLRREKQPDRAFADFNKAIQLQPEYHLSYLNRGNIYFDRGQDSLALLDYTKLITMESPFKVKGEKEPAVASAYSNRGAIYARNRMYDLALADLDKAISLDASNKDTWNNRAITHFEMGHNEESIADFRKFLQFDPNSAGAINTIGVCYLRMQKLNESLAEFNKALQLDPKLSVAYANRAIAYAGLGDTTTAIRDYQTAQSMGYPIDPNYLQALQR